VGRHLYIQKTLILIFYRLGFSVCMYIHIMIFDAVIQNNCISIIIVNVYDIFKYLIKINTINIKILTFHIIREI